MTLLLFLITLSLLGTNIFTLVRFNQVRVQLEQASAPDRMAIAPTSDVNPKHILDMTFTDRHLKTSRNKGQDFHGWHFLCECGTVAPAIDNDGRWKHTDKGTEAGAVRAWRAHHDLYSQLVEGGSEVARLKKELKEQKENCICHDLA